MCAYPLLGEVGGGWALELSSCLGHVKWHPADRRVPFGAQNYARGCINHRCINSYKRLLNVASGSWVQTIGGLPEESGVKVKARWRRSGGWVKDGCWENLVFFSMFFLIRISEAQNT
jgi:hypothetical protein